MRIECFDISNLGETHTVASMVVFEGGAPKKSDYRRFGIRDVAQDDFAAMNEVLSRRMAQYVRSASARRTSAPTTRASPPCPALIVIDGGKGQLSSGLAALEPFRDLGVTVVSAWPSGSRRSSSPAAPRRWCCRTTRRRCSCSSACATRRTGSRSSSTAGAATRR